MNYAKSTSAWLTTLGAIVLLSACSSANSVPSARLSQSVTHYNVQYAGTLQVCNGPSVDGTYTMKQIQIINPPSTTSGYELHASFSGTDALGNVWYWHGSSGDISHTNGDQTATFTGRTFENGKPYSVTHLTAIYHQNPNSSVVFDKVNSFGCG